MLLGSLSLTAVLHITVVVAELSDPLVWLLCTETELDCMLAIPVLCVHQFSREPFSLVLSLENSSIFQIPVARECRTHSSITSIIIHIVRLD